MKALVYHGPGSKAWEEVADPTIQADTDAIVQEPTQPSGRQLRPKAAASRDWLFSGTAGYG
jgi:hypothetical protein